MAVKLSYHKVLVSFEILLKEKYGEPLNNACDPPNVNEELIAKQLLGILGELYDSFVEITEPL